MRAEINRVLKGAVLKVKGGNEMLDELGFRFKIGDVVYHRLVAKREYKEDGTRNPLLIIGRQAHECSGGIQLHYECRLGIKNAITTFDPSRVYVLHEVEVEEE